MILNINSVIQNGKHKGKTIKDILDSNKKIIFELIKNGLLFDDEVLSIAGIKKNIRDVKVTHEFTEHEKDTKKYKKDTESLSKILKEIRVLDNLSENNGNNTDSSVQNNEYEDLDF